ncbi:MAG: LPS export ABC transporter ATP-binding protein [Pseudomonadota bacterium]
MHGTSHDPTVDQSKCLQASNLRKDYLGRRILVDVSITLRRGEAVGLLGPNGAGKTTCFYSIVGLIKTDEGEVSVDGRDVSRLPMYRRARYGIGYLPQEPSIFRGLSVLDNLRLVLETLQLTKSEVNDRALVLLEEFSISHLSNTKAVALSGGERRRLEIARALASEPRYILLDEPLAGIDPISVDEIRDLVGHLKERGLGVLITDHNVRDTLQIIDRAYILHNGSILTEGSPTEVIHNAAVRRVYLGDRFAL